MKQIQAMYCIPFDPKGNAETYFATLQRAKTYAELLGQPYTDIQLMNHAMDQFKAQIGHKAQKAELKWLAKPKHERTWTAFKQYWRDAMHCIKILGSNKRHANQAALTSENDMASIMETLQSITQHNNILSAEVENFQEAHNIRVPPPVTSGTPYDMSVLTDTLERFAAISTAMGTATSSTTNAASTRNCTSAKRNPKSFKHTNNGKGKIFASSCWRCGCNYTLWTQRYNFLTPEDCDKYKAADFDHRMDGSTKFLERRDCYQFEYAFDTSL
uniref:Uncharacterized protein n=1 Tax=Pseudo-nitzschia australis TaxID=44445 RepID=A0A7S4AB17_9STRA|mmetsp:Transcript_6483/g.13776  ORF Transcript_6483/g.13776 Transcript_6483/m.13776 type:complete len:272 (-) Transcript_6483:30-845(-)